MAYASWDSFHDDLLDGDGRVLPKWRDHVPPFDPARSRAVRMNGVLPEFIRTTPGALRSLNPGASMVALGARASWLTADHPLDYGFGEGSPLAKLIEMGGKVLMVGAPWDTMTLLHLAEHRAQIPGKRVLRYEVPYAAPEGTVWRMTEEFDTSEPVHDAMPEDCFERIVQAFVASGQGSEGSIGAAPSLLVDAKAICAFAVDWIEVRYGG
jgi:aminoglycoside 3-N-acetyltransferase